MEGNIQGLQTESYRGFNTENGRGSVEPISYDDSAVPAEIKEIAEIMRYFKAQDLGVRFTEILAWKDKTNQLEDKSNDTDTAKVQQDELGKLRDKLFV